MSALADVLVYAVAWVVRPPARWSLVWRVPVALALAVVALACYVADGLWRVVRRHVGGGRRGR